MSLYSQGVSPYFLVSYFSFDALLLEGVVDSRVSIVDRALLCVRKQAVLSCEMRAGSHSALSVAMPQRMIDLILSSLKGQRTTSAGALQEDIDSLAYFLLKLQDHVIYSDALPPSFKSLSSSLQDILLKFLDTLSDRASIEQDPTILLKVKDQKGRCCIEILMEHLYRIKNISSLIDKMCCYREKMQAKAYAADAMQSEMFVLIKDLCYWGYSHLIQQHAVYHPSYFYDAVQYAIEVLKKDKELFLRFSLGDKALHADDSYSACEMLSSDAFYMLIAQAYTLSDIGKLQHLIAHVSEISHEGIRLSLAKILVKRNGWLVAEHFLQFQIQEERNRIDLAMLCMTECQVTLSLYIENFAIQDRKALVEIAKLCAMRNTSHLIFHLHKFCIEQETDRAEIAMLCARYNGRCTAEEIARFNIKDLPSRIEIAKLCAKYDGEATAQHIKKFGINELHSLFEIAMLCTSSSPGKIAHYIKNFGPLEESCLIDIAMHSASLHAVGVASNIQKFGIKDPQALIKIARSCAQNDGEWTAYFIKNFGIEDPRILLDILKTCIFTSKENLFDKVVKNIYGLSLELGKEVKMYCCVQAVLSFELNIAVLHYILTELHQFVRDKIASQRYAFLQKVVHTFHEELTAAQIRQLVFICYVLLERKDKADVELVFQNAYVDAITYRDTTLSFYCIKNILACEDIDILQDILPKDKRGASVAMPMAAVAKWVYEAAGICHTPLGPIDIIRTCIDRCARSFLSDSAMMPLWIKACFDLDGINVLLPSDKKMDAPPLTLQDKSVIFAALCTNLDERFYVKDLQKRLSYLSILCQMNKMIDCIDVGDVTGCLLFHLQKHLFDDDYLQLKDTGDCMKRYIQTLGQMRIANAWKIYQMQIQQIEDSQLQATFQKVIYSILYGDFKKMRYREAETLCHVARILKNHEGIWSLWKDGQYCQKIKLSTCTEDIEPFSFACFLQQSCDDGHLAQAEQKILLRYLIDFIRKPSQRDAVKQQIELELKALPKDPILTFQNVMISLYEKNAGKEQVLSSFSKFEKCYEHLCGFEIINDLKGLKSDLRKQSSPSKEVLLTDSDDWQDLFLCGTEVSGSCQRIDGEPRLNKCLLAYLIDGKNRLLAIKDIETGKIEARCIFRILWNDTTQQPVLFQDRIYPSTAQETHSKALTDLAKQRAKDLGIALYTACDKKEENAIADVIMSLGSPAPYEYEDASDGVMLGGVFTLKDIKKVKMDR